MTLLPEETPMTEYGFGAFIRFTHQVVRYKTENGRMWVTVVDRYRYDQPPARSGEWPGEPVDPDSWNPGRPMWKDHRLAELEPPFNHDLSKPDLDLSLPVSRLRRLPFNAAGLVIGATYKQEGVAEWTRPSMDDDGSGYLSVQRTVRVLEVAIAPENWGKARVVLVWPGDVVSDA